RRPWFRLLNPHPTNPNPELLFTQDADQGAVYAVATWQGADGTVYVLSGGEDGTLKLWNWTEHRCLRVLHGHTSAVYTVVVTADGRHALSGSDDSALRWWGLAAGPSHQLRGHTGSVRAVALSPDGRHALSGSDDETLRWWDLAAGTSHQL